MSPPRLALLTLLSLTACHRADDARDPDPTPGFGDGVFAEGCPGPGRSIARVIGVDERLPGEAAVGTRGDLLLANERAAFAITDAVGQSTYWYYGGALADAAPMQGCVPGEDKLDDLGWVLAELDLLAVEQSVIRAFRGDVVEVVADGSDGGPAIVRATGTDDLHWLVEHTLINDAVDKGGRPVSQPWGLDIAIDYVLPPDSATLEIDLVIGNPGPDRIALVAAGLMSWGETLRRVAYASERLDLGGFGFDAGIPWLSATDGAGSYSLGAEGGNLALMSVSGVNVLVDLNQVTGGLDIGPGDQVTVRRFFAVGDGGSSTSASALLERVDRPLGSSAVEPATASGRLLDGSGQGIEGRVLLEARAPGSDWGLLDQVLTDLDGGFEVLTPEFDPPWELRVVGEADGRDPTEPVDILGGDEVSLAMGAVGHVTLSIHDGDGAVSPARLNLVRQGDGSQHRFWLTGEPDIPLEPGTWDWTLTRGYEYRPDSGTITVPADGTASIEGVLAHVVDTSGWMSIDTHVHTSDSPDSDVDQAEMLRHAAAHGLDIALFTEHENIVDRATVPADAGVDGWTNNALGEEVTSVGVEHMTMFPAEPDGSPRGGYVEWYGLDIDQLFGAMRARSGDGVNLLNHPSYLDRIQWNRVDAAPDLTDPTLIGLPSTGKLWSWNLDGIEVMNGHASPFIDGNHRFDNWMSMVNAGHPVVGVGCSDDHSGGSVGFPRTYFPHPSDVPAELDIDVAVEAFQAGAVEASAGAFARVDIDGAGPGELVSDADGMVDLNVHIEAIPEADVTHFVVFANCDMVDSVLATDAAGVEKYSGVVPLNVVGDTQVVIAAFGSQRLPAGLPQYDATHTPRVLTSPIYIDGDGDGLFTAPGGRECAYDLSVDAAL